jgi:hypothetical protein
MTTAEQSGKTGRLGRISVSARHDAYARRAVVFAGAMLALIGVGIARMSSAADDDHPAPSQPPGRDRRTDLKIPRSEGGPRLYTPLHPADPAQADKRFGLDPAFRQGRDRDSPTDREGPSPNSIRASGTPPELPAAAAK